MSKNISLTILFVSLTICAFSAKAMPQGVPPYSHAITDFAIHPETPMLPPPANVVFKDPDFGSQMVRVTDETTNFKGPGTFLRISGFGSVNEWSIDSRKFYVLGRGGQVFAFAFDPSTMAITSLPGAGPGQGLILPVRPGPSFSYVDPDLLYGTADPDTLTIVTYRFSTAAKSPVLDTRTCGVQPPLGTGNSVRSDDDISVSADDNRISISEGGPQFGKHMYVVIYDKVLGCRWYNTQTGEIGGQWGPSGIASVGTTFLIRHAHLARSGKYIRIATDHSGWYVWDLATLHVTQCDLKTESCNGYGAVGYDTFINSPAKIGDIDVVKRPLADLAQITPLVYPLPPPGYWGQPSNFSWNNVDENDSTPVCGSKYNYEGDPTIDRPLAGEIFCIETDGVSSTIWRFAHDRAIYVKPYFHTQPLANVSPDGRFFLFVSDWDAQLGIGTDGTPRSDVFIVKLE